MAEALQRENPSGFEGSVAGLPLTDVIQLKGQNRFSGCIAVEYRERQGMIFFRDGDIIHAEQGKLMGEMALYEIIRWPGGRFNIQPKVTTTSRTIQQSISFLLLEAHRLIDEEQAAVRADEGTRREEAAAPAAVQNRMSAVAERIVKIAGVSYAVLMKKDGTPLEDDSFEAEVLSAKGMGLAGIGSRLGELFGLDEVKSAAVHARGKQILLFEAKNHYVSIAVRGDSSLAHVENEIRSTFAGRK
ncbi:DUF4388 domain-containing protein [Geobacter sulfurreducens]|nr:DUF4388 domain-containing protein [Geobacter sulfurreducens]HML79990.1 DUF4388 domain-containing protein [Geobacter sulfurreducens]